jgi:hypothetical protein
LVEEITHGMPEGMIIHFASPTESGYRVTEVWQSEEHWKRFRTGVLTPLLQRLTGQDEPEQPDPQPFPVHAVRSRSTETGSVMNIAPVASPAGCLIRDRSSVAIELFSGSACGQSGGQVPVRVLTPLPRSLR